jgi:hypothetical protein
MRSMVSHLKNKQTSTDMTLMNQPKAAPPSSQLSSKEMNLIKEWTDKVPELEVRLKDQ